MRPSVSEGRRLRRKILVHGRTAGLASFALAVPAAHADVWRIFGGQVKGASPIVGFIEANGSSEPGAPPEYLIVETFGITAGKRSYTQANPLVYQRAEPVVQPGSSIHFVGDRIDHFSLR
jgi:hypothetical protein